MTDTHDNADSELNDAIALIKYSVEYRETHGGCPPEVKAIKRHGVSEAVAALTHWRDKAVVEALELAYQDLHEKHEDAARRGKDMTSGNRVKWARQNETLGESHARNQGFKSGILTAQAVVARIKLTQENSNGK